MRMSSLALILMLAAGCSRPVAKPIAASAVAEGRQAVLVVTKVSMDPRRDYVPRLTVTAKAPCGKVQIGQWEMDEVSLQGLLNRPNGRHIAEGETFGIVVSPPTRAGCPCGFNACYVKGGSCKPGGGHCYSGECTCHDKPGE